MNITYKAKEHTHTISEEDMDDLIRSEDNKSTDEEIKFEEKKNVSNDEVSSRKPAIVDIFKGLFGIAFGVIVIILVIAICTGKLDTLAYKLGLAERPDSMKGVATDTESDREYTTVDSEEKATDLRGEVESTSHPNGKDEEDEKESSEEHTKKDSLDFIEQYRKTIDSYEAEHSSNGDNPSYNLIWFDNDDTPELVAGLDGYYVSMYAFDREKNIVHCVIENWPYGAMGNSGYDYIPRANTIRNYNSDYAGMIRITYFGRMNSSYEIEDSVVLEADYYLDKNSDGEFSLEWDEYSDEAKRYADALTNKEISPEKYKSMMKYGNFEAISGKYTANEMKEKLLRLSDDNEFIEKKGYEISIEDCTWEEAFDKCIRQGGHLACFESPEEWQNMQEILKIEGITNISLYIGGRRNRDSNNYRWINADGEPGEEIINSSTYKAFWLDGEPSFEGSGIEECYMNIIYQKKADSWYFNDIPNDVINVSDSFSGTIGYICEYDGHCL